MVNFVKKLPRGRKSNAARIFILFLSRLEQKKFHLIKTADKVDLSGNYAVIILLRFVKYYEV